MASAVDLEITPRSGVEEVSTPARVNPEQLCGYWTDFDGKPVKVYSSDAFQVRLYATLTSHSGQSVNLRLREADLGLGWCCGDAVMTEFFSWQVTWTFPDGTLSQWASSLSASDVPEHVASEQLAGRREAMPGGYAAPPMFKECLPGLPAQFVAVPVFVPHACSFGAQPLPCVLPVACADGQQIVMMWNHQQTARVQHGGVSEEVFQPRQPEQPQRNLQLNHHSRRPRCSQHSGRTLHPHHTQCIQQPLEPWQFRPPQPQPDVPLQFQQCWSLPQTQPQAGQLQGTFPEAIVGRVWLLSRKAQGCREVQLAFDEAQGSVLLTLASELKGHIREAIECSHANHVVQKCIAKLKPEDSCFMIDEITAWGPGGATYMAKHRFGCRIFERLIERCPAESWQPLVEELLQEPRALCCHQFANYVMQHLLEFGLVDQRRRFVQQILSEVPRMSLHHRASAVVSKALQHGTAESRVAVSRELLKWPERFVHMAHQRFGHAVVAQIVELSGTEERIRARRLLAGRTTSLQSSRYGRMVAKCLGDPAQLCLGRDSALATHIPSPGAVCGA